ncbi:MAG: hypothetical protein AAF556_10155, partial [Pseudomonadota bacterium]
YCYRIYDDRGRHCWSAAIITDDVTAYWHTEDHPAETVEQRTERQANILRGFVALALGENEDFEQLRTIICDNLGPAELYRNRVFEECSSADIDQ